MLTAKAKTNRILFLIFSFVLYLFFHLTPSFAAGPIQEWSSTTPLPYLLASHGSLSKSNKVLILGGSAVTGQSKYEVQTSQINPNGELSSWAIESSPLPSALLFHVIARKDDFVYVLGGKEENPGSSLSHVQTVYLGTLDNSGETGAWTSLNPLPKALSLGAAVAIGNKLYYAGGFNQSETNQKIYVATVNNGGTLGAWAEAGDLPQPLFGLGMIEHNGKLIIVGGYNPGTNTFLDKTYVSTMDVNGNITGWQETSQLPQPVYRTGVIKIGNKILTAGGGINDPTKVYFADINNDNTLSTWNTSTHDIPSPGFSGGAITMSDEYIYLSGGFVGGAYRDNVFYTKINYGPVLNVPYFNQNDSPWGPSEYDHSITAGFGDPAFERWGCAVTSATMVLNYHGMTEFADSTPIDPGTVNTWLKNNNGYLFGNGYSYILWPAIGTLSKQLFDTAASTTKLEYKRIFKDENGSSAESNQLITQNLSNNIPTILRVKNPQTSMHFVVARGVGLNTFLLNDPEWNYPTMNSFDDYYQIEQFTLSNTDLSYLVAISNPQIEILAQAPDTQKTGKQFIGNILNSFNEIPEADYGFEPPISNPNAQNTLETLGSGVNAFHLPKPEDGTYKFYFSSQNPSIYDINIASLTEDGTITVHKLNGVTGETPEVATIDFSKNATSSAQTIVTFDSLISDIRELRELNLITKNAVSKNLIKLVQNAKKHDSNGRKILSIGELKAFQLLVKVSKQFINQQASNILQNNSSILIDSLGG